jgi:hypothetical protein
LTVLGVAFSGGSASALTAVDSIAVDYPGGYFKVDQSFPITAKAIDPLTSKVDKSVSGPAQVSDTSGQLEVISGGTFTAGVMNATVRVRTPFHHDRITVSTGTPAASGMSGTINIEGPLDHIAVDYPGSPQFSGASFNLPLTAFDSAGNVITTYNQAVTLSDLSGTVSSSETHTTSVPNHWVGGRETIPVQVGSPFSRDHITVTGAGGGAGTSGLFNVLFGGST